MPFLKIQQRIKEPFFRTSTLPFWNPSWNTEYSSKNEWNTPIDYLFEKFSSNSETYSVSFCFSTSSSLILDFSSVLFSFFFENPNETVFCSIFFSKQEVYVVCAFQNWRVHRLGRFVSGIRCTPFTSGVFSLSVRFL